MYKSEETSNTGNKLYCAKGLNVQEARALLLSVNMPFVFKLAISSMLDFYERTNEFVANVTMEEGKLCSVDFLMPLDFYYKDFQLCVFTATALIDGISEMKVEITINPARLRPELVNIINTLSAYTARHDVYTKIHVNDDGTIKLTFYDRTASSVTFYEHARAWYANDGNPVKEEEDE